jgi:hypothetical protein
MSININFNVKGRYDNVTQLNTAYPSGSPYAFAVGTPQSNEIYVWNDTAWISIGNLKGATGAVGQPGIQGEQGEPGVKGDKGDTGQGLEFLWNGTQLGVRVQGSPTYTYVDLKGIKGDKGDHGDQGIQGIQGEQGIQGIAGVDGTDGRGIEYIWNGTQLGIRYEGDTVYTYVDLKGEKGDPGNGDMSSATYDTDHDGVVERADTADKLTTARTINGVTFDGSANITIADDTKEPSVTAGLFTQFWAGNKTWRNLAADVRAVSLAGLSTATNAVIAATDSILAALGKLQAQVTDLGTSKANITSPTFSGNVSLPSTTTINSQTPYHSGNITNGDAAVSGTLANGAIYMEW